MPTWLEASIVEARRQRPHGGPKKLRAVLARSNPEVELPAESTFAKIFFRNGLLRPRRRRHLTPPASRPFGTVAGPNDLWCVDFKGHFATGRSRCHPLTVMDAYSRYLVACQALRRPDGTRWCGRTLFLSSTLPHELLGLDPVDADAWEFTFGAVLLGRIERPSGCRFRLRFVRCS